MPPLLKTTKTSIFFEKEEEKVSVAAAKNIYNFIKFAAKKNFFWSETTLGNWPRNNGNWLFLITNGA